MIYFSHDVFSREDIKIKQLIHKHGMLGYGTFWALTEILHNNNNKLCKSGLEFLASELRVELSLINSILFDFKLFRSNGETIYSNRVGRNIKTQKEISEKRRISAEKRWSKKSGNSGIIAKNEDANALQMESNCNAIKENKRKEKKVKKKSDNFSSFEEIASKIDKEGL